MINTRLFTLKHNLLVAFVERDNLDERIAQMKAQITLLQELEAEEFKPKGGRTLGEKADENTSADKDNTP